MDLQQEQQTIETGKKDQEPTDDEWNQVLDPTLLKIKEKEAEETREHYTKQQWLQLRWLAKHDLYFLCYSILGYTRLSPNLHGHYCKWLETNREQRFLMELLPRNHFKSTIETIGDSIQIVLPGGEDMPFPYNLGTNAALLIAHENHASAKRYLFEIAAHFLTNTALIALFPEIIPSKKKGHRINKEELELPRDKIQKEPTFDTMGVGASSQGKHYDILKLDDLVGKKQRDSEIEMLDVLDWFDNIQSFFRIFLLGKFRLVGTRWGDNDVYKHAEIVYGNKLKTYKRAAEEYNPVTKKKEPIFPEEVTSADLEILKKNKKVYRAQYENDPDSSTTEFDDKQFKWFGWGPNNVIINFATKERIDVRECNNFIFIDPADDGLGGYVCTATDHKGRHYVTEAYQMEMAAPAVCDWVFSKVIKWQPFGVAIEEVLFSALFKHWFESEMRLRKIYFNIIPYKTRNQTKQVRVRGLSNYFSANLIHFNEQYYSRSEPENGGDPLRKDSDLIYQAKKFPTVKHYHILDALAQGPGIWVPPVDKRKQEESAKKFKQQLDKRDVITGYSGI